MENILDLLSSNLFFVNNGDFYDLKYMNFVKKLVPNRWKCRELEFYSVFVLKEEMQSQGWKIHISSSLAEAYIVFSNVIPVLVNEQVPFKIIKSEKLHEISLQKGFPREESAKLITIYPFSNNQAISLLKHLDLVLKDVDGQNILSDKRYNNNSNLYYRYGSFTRNYVLDNYGFKKYLICMPDGGKIEDVGGVNYKKPHIFSSLFPDDTDSKKSELLRKVNVKKIIHVSNSGNVYSGIYYKNGKEIVIKEARKNMIQVIGFPNVNAISIQEEEYKNLRKLQEYSFVPKVYEHFADFENSYLIEERLYGEPLDHFVMKNNPLIYPNCTSEKIINYLRKIINIVSQLIDALQILEDNNILYTDLSLDNLILDENGLLKLIDFENIPKEKDICLSKVVINNRSSLNNSLVSLFLAFISRHEKLLRFDSSLIERTYKYYFSIFGIDTNFFDLIYLLKSDNDLNCIKKCIQTVSFKIKEKVIQDIYIEDFNDIYLTIKNDILENLQKNKDISCYPSNGGKNSYAFGRIGIFSYSKSILTDDVDEILKEYDDYISLFEGKLGIVNYLIEIGKEKKAANILKELRYSPLFSNNYSFGYGLAGYIYLLLKILEKDNDEILKEIVLEKIYYLHYKLSEENYKFEDYGFAKGLTGLAWIYLKAGKLLDNKKIVSFGKKLLEDEMEHLVETETDVLSLPYGEKDLRTSPYFSSGTSGFLSVLLQYNSFYQCDISHGCLDKLINGIKIYLTINPGQFEGLMSVGETFLDLYLFTNKKEYYDKALEVLNCIIQTFLIDKKFVPSNALNHCSYDYATGSVGFLEFYERLKNPKEISRKYID